jgi:TPR repeat protein
MADLAHDASGPASSEPAGIAQQQPNRPASSDKEKLRVFISYSRDDLDFADQLGDALNACGFQCLIDRHGISGGEDWKRRLGNLVTEADTVVFVLSPSSARSEICDWEVEEAARLNKRILPIVCRPLESVKPPSRLQKLDYSFFYKEPKVSGSGFGNGLAKLVAALNTDFDWLREHTRYLQRAIEWDRGGRPANRLLSGNDILEARAWAARRPKSAPEPTALQLDFIRASEEEAEARLSEQRKQLEAVAAAQAARETALNDRQEALKQAADAQRRRVTIRNIALIVVSGLAMLAGLLGWRAEQDRIVAQQQKQTAEQQKKQADDILARAATIISNLQDRMDVKTQQKVFELFKAGASHGDATSMVNLGISYRNGLGVAQDYTQARKWFEKAADTGDGDAMADVAVLYHQGQGVTRDDAKAREWLEKAAAKHNTGAMVALGGVYENGQGVAQDYTKARELYEKAADEGDASARTALEQLPIHELDTAGRYDEALQRQEVFAAKVEAVETKRDGKPGSETASALNDVAWYALFAKEFTKALTVAERGHALFPDNLSIETNRAHALMFIGHGEEAKALHLAHKGEVFKSQNQLWEQSIAEDFANFRKAGLTSPMMADIEKELGVSR